MPYVVPTTAELKLRFPIFQAVAEPILQGAIDEGSNRVDRTWREVDYQSAIMLFAAHTLTMDGQGTGREAKFAALAEAGISSIKISSLAISLRKAGAEGVTSTGSFRSAPFGTLRSTSFGKRFLDLMRLNHPAVVVVNGNA